MWVRYDRFRDRVRVWRVEGEEYITMTLAGARRAARTGVIVCYGPDDEQPSLTNVQKNDKTHVFIDSAELGREPEPEPEPVEVEEEYEE